MFDCFVPKDFESCEDRPMLAAESFLRNYGNSLLKEEILKHELLKKEMLMSLDKKKYWQVGDEVYSFQYGKGKIGSFTTCINCGFGEDSHSFRYYNDGTFKTEIQPIYHLGAITFDEQDRPVSINYDYIPKREPKYKKITEVKGIKALEAYTNDESLKVGVFIGDYEYLISHNEDEGIGLYNAQLDDSHPITLDLIQNGTWRIYEK